MDMIKTIKELKITRKKYWIFILISFIIFFTLSQFEKFSLIEVGRLKLIYAAIIVIPTIIISLKRLDDIKYSRWWFLINFIPFIGSILFIILMCKKSKISQI